MTTPLNTSLVANREEAMDRADGALGKMWPARLDETHVREMEAAAKDLEGIAAAMTAANVAHVEQSRTFRFLGSVYADLAPARGKSMLTKAAETYRKAEVLLGSEGEALEKAKLNFNFGNALRQIDPSDLPRLQEAERRLLAARDIFATHAANFLPQVDAALASTRALLKVAPVAGTVQRNLTELKQIERELAAGGDLATLAAKARELQQRDGGMAGLLAATEGVLDGLPASAASDSKYLELREQLLKLGSTAAATRDSGDAVEVGFFDLLKKKLIAETEQGRVTPERAKTLSSLLDNFGAASAPGDGSLQSLMTQVQDMREKTEAQFANLHYLSHGIARPPEESRAAALAERCWSLRRFLLEEMNRSGKGPTESKEILHLNIRASEVDRRIYEAGSDDARAFVVDREALRPLALDIRRFAARHHPLLASPIWSRARVPVATDSVLFSGTRQAAELVLQACRKLDLEVITAAKGESFAAARWAQLQKSNVAIFDLGAPDGSDRASVAYELGIAITLGKPVVVLGRAQEPLPFNVDVEPILLSAKAEDDLHGIVEAIDLALTWTMPRPQSGVLHQTIDEVLVRYPEPRSDVYTDQAVKQVERLREEPDLIALTAALKTLMDYGGAAGAMLLHSTWSPVYPKQGERRLFHVMPFRPEWAGAVSGQVERVCEQAGVEYVRGDRVKDADVIRTIWEQICGASHVLVDLTGFNTNVALELGIAHTLGRPTLMVGQGDTVDKLFPAISKLSFDAYGNAAGPQLEAALKRFLA